MTFCIRFKNDCPHCNGTGRIFDSEQVGNFLRKKRESLSNSLRDVAKRMGISAPYLSDLERGNRAWNLEKIDQYEDSLILMPILKSGTQVWIYGLFDKNGCCEYVGATSKPKKRKAVHVAALKHLKFRLLTSCDSKIAANKESETIRSYKQKGQCKLNKISHAVNCRGWNN
jgi:hypothetical protein